MTTFSTNAHLYLKCKVKNHIKNFIAKTNKKDCVLQSYIFTDTKGDDIQGTAFNKNVHNINNIIEEGCTYEIINPNIQLADRAYNSTKCYYKISFTEQTQINKVPDNGKFCGVTLIIIPLNQIDTIPIGKIIDVFGFILEDKGYQEILTKNDRNLKMQKLIIGDDSLTKIELTLWENLAKIDNIYTPGDLIAVKNCRVREFSGKKTLSSTDSTEIKKGLDPESDAKLKKFYAEHTNENDYKDIIGEALIPGLGKTPPELAFILDIQNSYEKEENTKRSAYEIIATVTKLNHSEKNYYLGCAKFYKKMETDSCIICSGTTKKIFLTISVNVRDASSFLWIDFFGETAEKFLGINGEQYENLLKNWTTPEENKGLIPINERIEYHTFYFTGKVKENYFNEAKRYRFSVYKFQEVNREKMKILTRTLSNLLK